MGAGMILAYFQALPDQDFRVEEIDFGGGALEVSFHVDAGIDPALAAKLQFQLDRLKLNERYGKQINKYLSEQRAAVLMFHEQGSELLSEFLRRSSVSQASSFGRNDWRVALLRALAADDAFCAAKSEEHTSEPQSPMRTSYAHL